MVFLSNLQVTAYWITNLSLNSFSFLFSTPALTALFLSTLKFWILVNKTFIHWSTIISNWIEIEYELQYTHSLLAIPHYQLKDK